jgi:nickel-dependent lactate racemase
LSDFVIELGFGRETRRLTVPEKNFAGLVQPQTPPPGPRGPELVVEALAAPVGTPRLSELAKPGEKIALIVSDLTRPFPAAEVLPPVLAELAAAGVRDEDLTVVFALGSHRAQSPQEREALVGPDIFRRLKCVDGDPADCLRLGLTSRGTPVDVTRVVAEAKLRLGLGNIEHHYFAGFSGGAKAVMPGVSSRAAIEANHGLMVQPGAKAGRLAGNPVREDLEEAVGRFGLLDFIVNVVLDDHKKIVHCSAGHFIEAHRAGCAVVDRLNAAPLARQADVVVASQGGAPKDLNLYQTQKALDNAKEAVRPGGIIVLVGSCREGLGEKVFEDWMLSAPDPASLVERVRTGFQLGGHKAAAIALTLARNDVYLVSELDPRLVERIFLKPFATPQQALDAALARLGPQAQALVMPHAGATLPLAPEAP